MKLTDKQRAMLEKGARHVNGDIVVRGDEDKKTLVELCDMHLVCDYHNFGEGFFTRITENGLEALREGAK